MAKQQAKSASSTVLKKPVSSEFNSFGYILRNAAIIVGIAILFAIIYKSNEKGGQLPELYQEFSQLQKANANPERQRELYDEIIAIQADTSYFKSLTKGYYWAIHDLALKNLEQINEMKNKMASGEMKPLTLEDKMGYKVGLYPLLKYVKEQTPENAVILLPPGDESISNNSKWNFIYEPEWVEYFIYPRLCVATGYEKNQPELSKRLTHVLIVEGKGYDKLKYDVPLEQRVQETILPINSPPASTQPK